MKNNLRRKNNMKLKEIKQYWIKEINEILAQAGDSIKETSIAKAYDASGERGMDLKLWLIGESNNSDEKYYYYMYITKKHEVKKYNGSVYANTQKDFEEDTKDYKYLGRIL